MYHWYIIKWPLSKAFPTTQTTQTNRNTHGCYRTQPSSTSTAPLLKIHHKERYLLKLALKPMVSQKNSQTPFYPSLKPKAPEAMHVEQWSATWRVEFDFPPLPWFPKTNCGYMGFKSAKKPMTWIAKISWCWWSTVTCQNTIANRQPGPTCGCFWGYPMNVLLFISLIFCGWWFSNLENHRLLDLSNDLHQPEENPKASWKVPEISLTT